MSRRKLLAAVSAVAVAATLSVAPGASASTGSDPQNNTAEVVGVVYSSVQVGDRTIIGGNFTTVGGLPRANVAAIRADGTVDPAFDPSTDGIVYALAASDDGTKVFLGGGFTTVGGLAHGRLAAVDPVTGALITSWKTATNSNLVRALATASNRLYVGGSFSRIGGKDINRLAAVNQTTGVVDATFAPRPNNTVRAVGVSPDGQSVYAGGPFSVIAGAARPGIAELSSTGAATSFAPTDGGVVIALDPVPDGSRVFFSTTNNRTWAYDPAVSNTPAYRVRTSGDVQAIEATDDEVYIGGHFSGLPEAKLERKTLASFHPGDGTATSWNPGTSNINFGVWTITAAADSLAIGGDFGRVAGERHPGFARFLGAP
jgi:hypothetical protein